MSSRRQTRQHKKQDSKNAKPKTPCHHDEDSTGIIFTYREKVPCHSGWSLEASLKNTAVQEVAATAISQEDDGKIRLINRAGRGPLSQLDDLQANQKISDAQMQK